MRKRKNLTLSPAVLERADAIMHARGFDELSDFVAALIREEYERRHPPALRDSTIPPEPAPEPAPGPVNYRAKRKAASSASKKDIGAQLTDKLKADFQKSKPPGAPPKS